MLLYKCQCHFKSQGHSSLVNDSMFVTFKLKCDNHKHSRLSYNMSFHTSITFNLQTCTRDTEGKTLLSHFFLVSVTT